MGIYLEDYTASKGTVEYHHGKGQKVVEARGTFDLFHPGHIDFLERAKGFGHILMVNVNNDIWAMHKIKTGKVLVRPEKDRAELIARLDFVDYVFVYPQSKAPLDMHPAIALALYSRPDVLVREDKDLEFQKLEKEILSKYSGLNIPEELRYNPEFVALSRSAYDESSSSILSRAKEVLRPEISHEIRQEVYEQLIAEVLNELGLLYNKEQLDELKEKIMHNEDISKET